MNKGLVCWKCGTAVDTEGRFARLEACRQCGAELHACIMCRFYEPRHAEACAEERAEPPGVKDRANFCDYFQPRADAFRGGHAPAESAARTQLEALFGGTAEPSTHEDADEARRTLESLFKSPE